MRLAWLVVAACGGSGQTPIDSQSGDAGADANAIDSAPDTPQRGTVYVHALDPQYRALPLPDAPLVFLDPDGTVASTTMTDMFGNGHGDVLPGGGVVEVHGNGMFWIQAIAPGDHLTIGFEDDQAPPIGTFTVTYPARTGATSYAIYGPCIGGGSTTSTSYTWSISEACEVASMDILVLAKNASGVVIAYADRPNVPYQDGGTVAQTGWISSNAMFTTNLTNIGAEVTYVSAYRRAPAGYGLLIGGAMLQPTGTSMLITLPGPNTGTAEFDTGIYNSANRQLIRDRRPGTATEYDLDVEGALLPWIGASSIDTTTGHVTVPTTGAGTPDVVETILSYQRGATQYAWFIYGPTPGDFTLPQLPASLGPLGPQPGDTPQAVYVEASDCDSIDGWPFARLDALRISQDEGTAVGPGTHWITTTTP